MTTQPVNASGTPSIRLSGALDSAAVPAVWNSVRAQLISGAIVRVDLSAIEEIDSSALAMIADWAGEADRQGARLVLEQVPAKLVALARISDLEPLLRRLGSAAV